MIVLANANVTPLACSRVAESPLLSNERSQGEFFLSIEEKKMSLQYRFQLISAQLAIISALSFWAAKLI